MPVATVKIQPRAATGLGALTTAFAAPSSCEMNGENLVTGAHNNYWQLGPNDTDTGCYPDHWVLDGYYQPGVCPENYTAACSDTNFNGLVTTTCCPNYGDYLCATSHPATRDESTLGCSSSFTYTSTRTLDDRTTTATGGIVWAHSVQVQNDDATVSTVTSSVTAPAETASDVSSSSSTGLSDGAIAGIAVGAAAIVITLIAAGAFFLWRRRKGQPQPKPVERDTSQETVAETPSGPSEIGFDERERQHELPVEGQVRWGLPLLPSSPSSANASPSRPWQPPQEVHGEGGA